jgi:predicted site-specific integrase-resolvase
MTPREAERRRRQRADSPANPIRVIPFLDWCALCGFSKATGERIIKAGKVKVTDLSPRRRGIREDHHAEYLESCRRDGA